MRQRQLRLNDDERWAVIFALRDRMERNEEQAAALFNARKYRTLFADALNEMRICHELQLRLRRADGRR